MCLGVVHGGAVEGFVFYHALYVALLGFGGREVVEHALFHLFELVHVVCVQGVVWLFFVWGNVNGG